MTRISTLPRSALLGLCTLSAAACAGTSQGPDTPSPTASAQASAAPTLAPSTSPGAAPTTAAPSTPPPPVSKFVAVSPLPGASTLYPVDGALLIARDETDEVKPEGTWGLMIGVVEGDQADFSRKLLLDGMHRVIQISGTWPDAMDVLAMGDTGRTGIAEHYKLGGKGLQASSAKVGQFFLGVAKVGSSVLAMHAPMFPFSELPKVVTVRGPALSYKPQPADKKCEAQKAAVFPVAFGATGEGALLAYGSTCDDKPAVEMWSAPGQPSTVTPLPEGEIDRAASLVPGAGKEAWLLASSVMRFDGAAWKKLAPPPSPVIEGTVAPDGVFWGVTSKGGLLTWRNDGWQDEILPDGAAAGHVAITKDGTVWVTTASALLRTRRTADREGVKLDAKDKAPPARKRRLSPGGKSCTSNLVILYGFTKVTPDDYDFPLTRKALKGQKQYGKVRFVVTKDAGQKFFTAMVPDYDTGKSLVALVEKNVQGAKPQLVCAEPEIVREVKIDLATGDVVK